MLPHQAALRPTGRRQDVSDLEVRDGGSDVTEAEVGLSLPELVPMRNRRRRRIRSEKSKIRAQKALNVTALIITDSKLVE